MVQNQRAPGEPAYKIDSVDSALRLLLAFRERKAIRVTEAAQLLGVARSTAHRLLAMLQYHGFVAQDRVTRAYRTGRVLMEIGLIAIGDLDVRRRARAHLEVLSRDLGETANLLVLEGGDVRFVDGVEGTQILRVGTRTGLLLPAYATSGGKAMLAEFPPDQVRDRYPDGLVALTPSTVVDFAALEAELAVVREQGFATNHEESEVGLAAVAVCVRDRFDHPVAALAVSLPVNRLSTARATTIARALHAAASAIREDLQ